MLIVLILSVTLSLAGSFMCSLCEAALYTVTDAQVGAMIQQRKWGARTLARMRSNMDRAVAAILTVNTVAHTVGASVAGAAVGALTGSTGLAIFSAIFTVAILIITEIIPKSIGIARAGAVAPKTAWIVEFMIWSMFPLVIVSERLTRLLNRGVKREGPSEHEILSLTRMAVRLGSLQAHEAELVSNALELDEYEVREIMTPRSVTFVLPDKLRITDTDQHAQHWVHSRLPVIRDENPNEILGIVHRRDVFDVLVSESPKDKDKRIQDIMRPVRFIGASAGADEALREFLAGRQHMFVVVDEYGTWVGIVTLEDVLETLLGREIVGEHDPVADMQDLARQQAAARGIDLDEPDDDDETAETEDWSDPARWAEAMEREDREAEQRKKEEREERRGGGEIEVESRSDDPANEQR
ncbi:MAG: CNNM domain-containing protein [Phycisphaerales bacterium]